VRILPEEENPKQKSRIKLQVRELPVQQGATSLSTVSCGTPFKKQNLKRSQQQKALEIAGESVDEC
jgi:hypothetical protein